jgi:hypothetical protein
MIGVMVAAAWLASDLPTSLEDLPPDVAPELPAPMPAPIEDGDGPRPAPAHPYIRTTLETTALLAAGVAWYWHHPSYSDWDLSFSWESWKSKLFSDRNIVFDDNRFDTNAVNHPIAGAAYYQIARGNGFGVATSLLSSFLASTAWEYFVEFNEKPSTNDLILTPVGGMVLGEASYRLGRLFYEGEPGLINCVGAIVFSPVATLNDAAVCRGSGGQPPFDRAGFSRRTWHRVALEVGRTRTIFEAGGVSDETALGLGADLVAHRAYQRPGEGITTALPGQWSVFDGRVLFGDRAVRGSDVHAHTVLYGRYLRRYAPQSAEGHGPTNGRGLMVGVGSTFDYDTRDLEPISDRTASAGLLGPMLELALRRGALAVRAALSAQYSIALVQSLAYPAAAASFAGVFIKSELREQGYYYAQGLTTTSTLTVDLGTFDFAFDGRFGRYRSFDEGDRYQGEIQNNFPLNDMRLFLRAAVAARPFRGPFRLALGVDQTYRQSRIPGYVATANETRTGLSAILTF